MNLQTRFHGCLIGLACGDENISPLTIKWPKPWKPINNEWEALEFGRTINPAISGTIIGELQREICDSHQLYGVECQPLAYDALIKKDFLFMTDKQNFPFVIVHFTWQKEINPLWPMTKEFQTLKAFIAHERRHNAYWWEFWKH